MTVELRNDIDINNVLSLYSTDAVLKRSKKVNAYSIESVYGDAFGTHEFLVTMKEHKLPHTVIISADDILCSCIGFMSTFKCQKLCTHLILCVRELYDKGLLQSDTIVEYLKRWKNRNDSDS